MNKQYLTLDNHPYRVVVNWNSTANYCKRKGIINLVDIDHIGKFTIDDILPLAFCCIEEGERIDGHDFTLSETELGELLSPQSMTEFIQIYADLSAPKLPPSKPETGGLKKNG